MTVTKRHFMHAFAIFAVIVGALGALTTVSHAQTFTVSYGTSASPNLIKNKIGVYQTPFFFLTNPPSSYNMSTLMQEAGVQDMRYEMGLGKPDTYAYDQVSGTPTNLTYDFSKLDPFLQQMAASGVRPLIAMTYDPLPLKTGTDWQRWKDVPSSLSAWSTINQQYASHYSNTLGIKNIAYEMWNEPDLPGDGGKVFFNGNQSDYGNVFAYGASGIRAGASDAIVGGPAVAYDGSYINQSGMLNDSPNFISIHAYANYPTQIQTAENAMGGAQVPIYITEYASYTSFGATAPCSTHAAAAAFFEDVKGLLTYSNVTKVYWAQWIDDSLGMITNNLHRKALFNAYKIYQTMLPVNRCAVSPDSSSGIDLMASKDSNSSGVVAWNNNTSDKTVTLNLTGLPGSGGTVNLYRIDSTHASYIDNNASENLAVNGTYTYTGTSYTWTGTIPAQSLVFLSATASGGVTEAAYNGPHNLPGTVQNEDYDTGGEGVAYHDAEAANLGGQYRPSEGVDIETCTDTGGGYNVGWTNAGEYLKYTVNVATAGTYQVSFRTSAGAGAGSFHLQTPGGTNLTGTVSVPSTGGWQTWETVTANVTLPAGSQVLELYEDSGNTNLNSMTFTATAPAEAAYNGPHNLPGTVQIEDYDTGGEGVAYHDTEAANLGGQYRTSEGVDIEACTDTGGGYNVGWTNAGEYMKYTVNVATAGTYQVSFRTSAGAGAGSFHLQTPGGTNLTGTVSVPSTGGWQNWTTVTANVTLPAGSQVLELYEDSGNTNLNSMTFAAVAPPTVPNASFETPSVGSANFQYTPSGASWSFASTSGIQSNGSAWGAPNAPSGTQTAFLQGYSGGVGSMSQSVTFAGTGNYAVTFQGAQRSGQVQPIKVSVDGVQVGGLLTPAGSSFGLLTSGTFTISTAGAHTLTLSATSTSADLTSFVDQVSLVAK